MRIVASVSGMIFLGVALEISQNMRFFACVVLCEVYNNNCGQYILIFRDRKEASAMTKFIINVNKYLSEMRIKQAYLSMITGIDKNKMSRLLTGTQEESGSDMEKIAQGLGKRVEFFLADTVIVPRINTSTINKIAFYAGEPSGEQEQIANQLMELMENIDEVLSAKSRFANIARG